jgi:predicted O-methyltransferase YrrM
MSVSGGKTDGMLPRTAENFIKSLTGAATEEIRRFTAEITANRYFRDELERHRDCPGRRRYSSWGIGIGSTLGIVLYVLCRQQRPGIVVETGVASGISSSYILCALRQNTHGKLYSIDMPGWGDSQSGWLIPDYLRHRWHLTLGRSSETLGPLLERIGNIDMFLHDSDHSYRNMTWEFQTAWSYLNSGGLLLSHNIDYNNAFPDFCRNVGLRGSVLENTGGLVKP